MNANSIMKVRSGDFIQFGKTALFAGTVRGKVREGVLVEINDAQEAIVPTSSIKAVNCRNVGDNVLTIII